LDHARLPSARWFLGHATPNANPNANPNAKPRKLTVKQAAKRLKHKRLTVIHALLRIETRQAAIDRTTASLVRVLGLAFFRQAEIDCDCEKEKEKQNEMYELYEMYEDMEREMRNETRRNTNRKTHNTHNDRNTHRNTRRNTNRKTHGQSLVETQSARLLGACLLGHNAVQDMPPDPNFVTLTVRSFSGQVVQQSLHRRTDSFYYALRDLLKDDMYTSLLWMRQPTLDNSGPRQPQQHKANGQDDELQDGELGELEDGELQDGELQDGELGELEDGKRLPDLPELKRIHVHDTVGFTVGEHAGASSEVTLYKLRV
jgi:hypothetical protein